MERLGDKLKGSGALPVRVVGPGAYVFVPMQGTKPPECTKTEVLELAGVRNIPRIDCGGCWGWGCEAKKKGSGTDATLL